VPWHTAERIAVCCQKKNGVLEENKLTSVVVSVLGRDTIIFTVEMGILAVTRSGDPSAGGQGVSRGG
jgi:hypothetical protein